jgi:hypothetical protein
MKCCRTCKIDKPYYEYYKNSLRKDGYEVDCKKCCNKRNNEYRRRTGYNRTEKMKEYRRKTGKTLYSYRREILLRYSAKNKEAIKARVAVREAIKKGEIERLPCQKCGESKVQAHHHNGYNREHWLDIIWLCQEHHTQAHHK